MIGSSRGQMILETALALGLLAIGSLTLASFTASIRPLARHGSGELRALLLAQEGIEAARSIRDADFEFLTDGAHGIALATTSWAFAGTSDTQDGFTRTVTVSGIDIRTKKIMSAVLGQNASSTLTTALVDIDQDIGMADSVAFDIIGARIGGGNDALDGMKIVNAGPFPITITSITAWWGDNSKIQSVRLGNTVWSHNGTGLPSGKQASGTALDIVDFTLPGGQSENDTEFKFNGPVSTVNFMIKFTFADNSTAYVTIQPS